MIPLPNEILADVVEELMRQSKPHKDILALVLTCRRLQALATPFLFRHLAAQHVSHSRLTQAIATQQNARAVRSAMVIYSNDLTLSILRPCKNINSLSAAYTGPAASHDLYPNSDGEDFNSADREDEDETDEESSKRDDSQPWESASGWSSSLLDSLAFSSTLRNLNLTLDDSDHDLTDHRDLDCSRLMQLIRRWCESCVNLCRLTVGITRDYGCDILWDFAVAGERESALSVRGPLPEYSWLAVAARIACLSGLYLASYELSIGAYELYSNDKGLAFSTDAAVQALLAHISTLHPQLKIGTVDAPIPAAVLQLFPSCELVIITNAFASFDTSEIDDDAFLHLFQPLAHLPHLKAVDVILSPNTFYQLFLSNLVWHSFDTFQDPLHIPTLQTFRLMLQLTKSDPLVLDGYSADTYRTFLHLLQECSLLRPAVSWEIHVGPTSTAKEEQDAKGSKNGNYICLRLRGNVLQVLKRHDQEAFVDDIQEIASEIHAEAQSAQ